MHKPTRTTSDDLPPAAKQALLETVQAYDALVRYLYLSDGSDRTGRRSDVVLRSAHALVRATRTAERLGTTAELSRIYSALSTLLSFIGAPGRARDYATEARQIAEEVKDRHALFQALTVGQLHAFVLGAWDQVEAALQEAMAIGAELRLTHDCLVFEHALGLVYLHQGRLDMATSRLEGMRERAREHRDRIPELWATATLADVVYRRGDTMESMALAESALALAEQHKLVDHNSRFQAHGLLASACLRQSQPEQAARHMLQARTEADAGGYLSYSPQSGFRGVAEVLLAQVTQGDPLAARQLGAWLRLMRIMGYSRPILAPWAQIFRARYSVVRGRRRAALRQVRRAVRTADRLQLAYEGAVARSELAGLLATSDAERQTVQQEARAIFDRIGVRHV